MHFTTTREQFLLAGKLTLVGANNYQPGLLDELRASPGTQYINDEVVERVTYNGEEILQPRQRLTREEQFELLDTHPMFTSKCPQCEYTFDRDYTARVHWDCPECGWMDDSV